MATINPFYRFEPANQNSGFYPDCNNKSLLLNQMSANIIGSWNPTGQGIGEAVFSLKSIVNYYNQETLKGKFVCEITERNDYAPPDFEIKVQIYNSELR